MDEWQGQAAGKGEKIVIAECGYTMEELVPLVGELAGSYAGYESSSISYEKAQQLMEAVLKITRLGLSRETRSPRAARG